MTKEVILTCGCGESTKTIEWVDIPNRCDVCGKQVHVKASLSRLTGKADAKSEPVAEVEAAEDKPKKKSKKGAEELSDDN